MRRYANEMRMRDRFWRALDDELARRRDLERDAAREAKEAWQARAIAATVPPTPVAWRPPARRA